MSEQLIANQVVGSGEKLKLLRALEQSLCVRNPKLLPPGLNLAVPNADVTQVVALLEEERDAILDQVNALATRIKKL